MGQLKIIIFIDIRSSRSSLPISAVSWGIFGIWNLSPNYPCKGLKRLVFKLLLNEHPLHIHRNRLTDHLGTWCWGSSVCWLILTPIHWETRAFNCLYTTAKKSIWKGQHQFELPALDWCDFINFINDTLSMWGVWTWTWTSFVFFLRFKGNFHMKHLQLLKNPKESRGLEVRCFLTTFPHTANFLETSELHGFDTHKISQVSTTHPRISIHIYIYEKRTWRI